MEHLKHFDEVLKYINELSNSIDLPTTLLRAQYLFRRFQRTVEAIDRKQNFPAPSNVRQRKPPATSATSDNTAATANKGKASPTIKGKAVAATTANDVPDELEVETKVISPELRSLLNRKVEKLDHQMVVEHGGGLR
ncbi:MAG: hypothetical protein L6R42_003504 [Xanthoria sp. 1 TBL-2021]|nr:MAG: hypothetical protein L6R42_003504 [Xanthoria sp. 1 TBL-2021]